MIENTIRVKESYLAQSVSKENTWFLFTRTGNEIEITRYKNRLKFSYQLGSEIVNELKTLLLEEEKDEVEKSRSKITKNDIAAMKYYRSKGLSYMCISKKLKVSKFTVMETLKGQRNIELINGLLN